MVNLDLFRKDGCENIGLSPMDEIIGAAPTSSGWKPDVLAGKLYLHN